MGRPSSVVENWKPKLEAYLNDLEAAYISQIQEKRSPTLPRTNDGMVNISVVAKALGCPKAYIYDYPELQTLLDIFAEGQGLLPSGSRTLSAADNVVRTRIAAVAKTARVDAQSALEARAGLQEALVRIAEQERELLTLRLENGSLREQLSLMLQGIVVRVD